MIEGIRAVDAHGAQVAHVEGDGGRAAGPMLRHGARRVGQRHLPAAERDHLGSQREVRRMERRDPERAWCAVVGGHPARLGGSGQQAV